MTEENSAAESQINETPEEISTPSRSVWSYLMPGIAIVLALAALGLSAYLYYLSSNFQTRFAGTMQQISDDRDRLVGRFTRLETNAETVAGNIRNLAAQDSQLEEKLQALPAFTQQRSKGWEVTEVESLLIIATQRIALTRDITTALVALQTADERLRDLGDPSLLPVRRQVNADLNALKAIPNVDISGLVLNLADLVTRVEQLPLNQPDLNTGSEGSTTAEPQGDVPAWKRILTLFWRELKGLVVISREGDAAALSLLPEQRYYLYQNLRLQLETARLAVMQRDTGNLHASVQIVTAWLNQYFDTADSGVNSVLGSMQDMSDIDLNPPLPDISGSLKILRATLAQSAHTDS